MQLPPEILHHTVRQLDPISLIALSQTSRAWRALINPIHHDFVQRLLALELQPEHGGIVPRFTEREGSFSFTPPWTINGWKAINYACCGCMKLRTHMMFDNHAILRRPYRKPPPGSVEAGKAALTDWEPVEPSARWRLVQKRAAQEEQERRRWVKMARRSYKPPAVPAHPFERQPPTHDDAYYQEVERLFTGTSRQKRRCIECRRLRGDWSRGSLSLRGSEEFPVVVSRQFPFPSLWERHFPGLLEPLPADKYPRRWRGYGESAKYTLYAACCPSCNTWQESSAFRQWILHRRGFPDPQQPVRPLLCNRCHLDTYQDSALLAQELTNGAMMTVDLQRRHALSCLIFGWPFIEQDFLGVKGPLSKYQAVRDEILGGLPLAELREAKVVLKLEELPDYRRRLQRYREFISKEVDEKTRAEIMQSWFKLWVEDYELIEGMYRWLNEQTAKLAADPYLVLNYVLEKGPYRI
ncbi:hypothetical protein C8A03DRAFT_45252 [Achaetomium macrosporum]|uniref:F-box domain-containing protein n=1 Tax=Achaetomium macrosporum TaxID=79813 RepID=A0AAN7C7C9_9PEZI|nr:hypothetical protein C8A03DRAFT_45252 [Achaetomium macrosporum]